MSRVDGPIHPKHEGRERYTECRRYALWIGGPKFGDREQNWYRKLWANWRRNKIYCESQQSVQSEFELTPRGCRGFVSLFLFVLVNAFAVSCAWVRTLVAFGTSQFVYRNRPIASIFIRKKLELPETSKTTPNRSLRTIYTTLGQLSTIKPSNYQAFGYPVVPSVRQIASKVNGNVVERGKRSRGARRKNRGRKGGRGSTCEGRRDARDRQWVGDAVWRKAWITSLRRHRPSSTPWTASPSTICTPPPSDQHHPPSLSPSVTHRHPAVSCTKPAGRRCMPRRPRSAPRCTASLDASVSRFSYVNTDKPPVCVTPRHAI